jgi:hypothetical protein
MSRDDPSNGLEVPSEVVRAEEVLLDAQLRCGAHSVREVVVGE